LKEKNEDIIIRNKKRDGWMYLCTKYKDNIEGIILKRIVFEKLTGEE